MIDPCISASSGHKFDFLSSVYPDDFDQKIIASIVKGGGAVHRDADIFQQLVRIVAADKKLPFNLTDQERFFFKNNTREQALEYLTYRYKFHLAHTERFPFDFPPYLLIEPISSCNLRCPMCFQVDFSFTRKPYMGVMKWDLFTSVIDQAAEESCYAITLASRGEPLLHPRIGEMLEYISAKKRFYDIKVNTNGTSLDERMAHTLLSTDLNILVFSIDHYEKDSYERIRVNANFDEVKRNLEKALEIREKHYPRSKCEFRISGVRVDQHLDEEIFRDFWSSSVGGPSSITLSDMIPRWDTYTNEPHPDNNSPCSLLWDRMYVWFDGQCNPCDADYKSYLCYGNASRQPLKEIWNGPKLAKLRKAHMDEKRSEIEPCDRCGLSFD